MSHVVADGQRQRKRRATSERIASAAARLVAGHGLTETTVDQIAAAAEVGRATFFRYFDTKEGAVAAGFALEWLAVIVAELDHQPASLGPVDALRGAFRQLAKGFGAQRELVLLQARLSRSSATLEAWTLQLYVGFEEAIATSLTPRFDDLRRDDLRPRLLGALAMSVIRLTLDRWVATDGKANLPAMIDRGLTSITISAPSPTPTRKPHR